MGSRLADFYEKKYEVWAPAHRELDFTDENRTLEAVRTFRPEVVIHCGAISDVAACGQNPELSLAVNVKGTQHLAKASAQVGARFVFCSSDQVYFKESVTWTESDCAEGGAGKEQAEAVENFLQPHREEEELVPMPLYGQHKLRAEQLAFQEQPDSVILRLTWMYGKLTEAERTKGRRNLLSMLEDALLKQQAVWFSATDYRGVTNVEEVVRNMEVAWKLPAGIYNYGSAGGMSVYETVRRAMAAIGQEALVLKGTGASWRNIAMDTAKLEAAGIHFSRTKEGLAECLRDFEGQGA